MTSIFSDPGPPGRPINDAKLTRKAVFDSALSAVQAIPPVSNATHTLELSDAGYEGPEEFSHADHKAAMLNGNSLGRRLRATMTLKHNATGEVLSQKRTTLSTIPYYTDAGTFVDKGTEYTLANQLRLKPGIYTRVKANGEVESHCNPTPGSGVPHRIFLDPKTGIFRLKIGQAQLPLVPLLQALGATNDDLRKAWGPGLAAVNLQKTNSGDIGKLYTRIVRSPSTHSPAEQQAQIRQVMEATKLDPESTEKTLGRAFSNISLDSALTTTRKLLAVHNRKDPDTLAKLGLEPSDEDDRDNLAHMQLLGPEDIIAERLRSAARSLNPVLWKAARQNELKSAVTGLFHRAVRGAFLDTGLGGVSEGINPSQLFDQQMRVTRMGTGGIPCYSFDTEVFTEAGWKFWPEICESDKLAILQDGQIQFSKPLALHSADFSGDMLCGRTTQLQYCVTPEHRMFVQIMTTSRVAGRAASTWADWRFETAEERHGKPSRHLTSAEYGGGVSPDFWVLPPAPLDTANKAKDPQVETRVPFRTWVAFTAAYLADGSTTYATSRGEYCVEIGKCADSNLPEVELLQTHLAGLPFKWRYEQGRRFVIKNKQLAAYMRQFGKSRFKFVPSEIMQAGLAERKLFLDLVTTFDNSRMTADSRLYSSTSRRLRDDVAKLAVLCGKTVRCFDNGYEFKVTLRATSTVTISKQKQKRQFFTRPYSGKVYCATVAGGLVLVRLGTGCAMWCGNSPDSIPASARSVQGSHFGFIDPTLTPESMSAGVDSRLSYHVRKGPNGEMYAPLRNAKTGAVEWKEPKDLYHSVIAFPNELRRAQEEGDTHVDAMYRGKMGSHPIGDVHYDLPDMESAFSPLANMVPMKEGMKGQRVAMAARMTTQALPLENAEAPLVQSGVPGSDQSFEHLYGVRMGAIRSERGGRVLATSPGEIQVQYDDGSKASIPLSQYRPNNRKTMFHQTPTVQMGDRFEPGGLLARSNYTDNQGRASLGLNARVAYAVARGSNYEDAIALSESMAKRLSSQHLYQHPVEHTEDTHKVSKHGWASIFPGVYNRKQLEALDDDGVVTPGRIVEFGDPLVLVANKRTGRVGAVSGSRSQSFRDQTETWTHHTPGVVTDVHKSDKGVNVAVHTVMPLQVGDKVSNRFGGKGVVGRVIPDHEMPVGEDGRPVELLLNPLGVISRGNPNQVIETVLGKIAEKTGKPYIMQGFMHGQDLRKFAEQEMAKHGVKDLEDLHDPVTGAKLPQVLTGSTFLMKLHHTSESKEGERAFGAYTQDASPAKGGPDGAKTWGMLHLNALLSHGATNVIADAHRVRGQRNTAYWAAVMSGRTPPDPEPSLVYDKFLSHLQGSGINPVRRGAKTHLMAMTNADIDSLAGDRELKNAETVDWNHANLAPVVGGLFDEKTFGGASGNRWGKISLDEPMPNPVMEEPIRRLLGLTSAKFRDVLSGKAQLNNQTGPAAISEALSRIDVSKELEKARYTLRNGRKTERDTAIRKLGFLLGSEKTGVHPKDWMWNAVPVLPPKFRPVSKMSNGVPMVADANYLYRELFEAKRLAKQGLAAFGNNGDERLNLYDTMKAVAGLGDPTSEKLQQQQVKGLLRHVIGDSPKTGMMQRKLLGIRADLVGRGTVIPNPNLDMDQIAIPENMAWRVYQPFIVRHLVQRGMSPMRAATAVADKHAVARQALLGVMKERPVILDRSPVWHRYGIMAFRPQLTCGSNIETNVSINKGFGLDHDGDAMQVHVPGTDRAVEDALTKMLPSQNLLDVATFRPHMVPSQEFLGGVHSASVDKDDKPPLTFATSADALRAFKRGEIGAGQEVHILDERG